MLKVLDLLARSENWQQGRYASNLEGYQCKSITAPEANCFDLSGAIRRKHGIESCDSKLSDAAREDFVAVCKWLGLGDYYPEGLVIKWNDAEDRTYEDVIAVVKGTGI